MKYRRSFHSRIAGFTVVECLISLAICAMLMTAVAVAFNASLVNFRENEEMFQSINSARQALTRMTTQLRTAGYNDPNSGWLGVLHESESTASPDKCSLWTRDGDYITYEYRDASDPDYPNSLVLISDGNPYKLCDNVTEATFTTAGPTPGEHAESVLISLTVRCGDSERKLSAAAVIRGAL